MSELFDFEASTRNMILPLYTGQEFPAVVREPTPTMMIRVENEIGRAKKNARTKLVLKYGMRHLVSIERFGIRDTNGELVPLVCDPDAKGYDPKWKSRLAHTAAGMKIAALVVGELFTTAPKKEVDEDELPDDLDFDLDDIEDGGQRQGEKQPAAGAKAEKNGGK